MHRQRQQSQRYKALSFLLSAHWRCVAPPIIEEEFTASGNPACGIYSNIRFQEVSGPAVATQGGARAAANFAIGVRRVATTLVHCRVDLVSEASLVQLQHTNKSVESQCCQPRAHLQEQVKHATLSVFNVTHLINGFWREQKLGVVRDVVDAEIRGVC